MGVSGDPGVLNDVLLDGQEFRYLLNRAVAEGVWGATDHQVTPGGPTRSVDVAPGLAYVEGDTLAYYQGLYGCANQATANSNSFEAGGIPANGTGNPRIDQIVLRVYDHAHDGSGLKKWRYEVVVGTATAGATLANRNGAAGLPASALRLADVLVAAGATSIGAGDIRDRRPIRPSPLVPVGSISSFAGATAPPGYLLARGQSTGIYRTQYEALFAVLSTTYGAGDGTTTFTLPDLQERVPVGLKPGGYSAFDTLGEWGGEFAHVLAGTEMPSHAHTGGTYQADINHQHYAGSPQSLPHSGSSGYVSVLWSGADDRGTTGMVGANPHGHSIAAEGGGLGHNNIQPYQVVNYIIKAF